MRKTHLTGLVAAPALALAPPPSSVTGGGTRADGARTWVVGGTIRRTPTGVVGHFHVIATVPPYQYAPLVCFYERFGNVTVTPSGFAADALGVCTGENESGPFQFTASNRISIVDNTPAAADTFDMNFYGPTGIAVPGGPIRGDFLVD